MLGQRVFRTRRPSTLPALARPRLPAIPPNNIVAFAVMFAATYLLSWQGATLVEAVAVVETLAGTILFVPWHRWVGQP